VSRVTFCVYTGGGIILRWTSTWQKRKSYFGPSSTIEHGSTVAQNMWDSKKFLGRSTISSDHWEVLSI